MAELNSRLLGRKTDNSQSSSASDAVSTDSRKPDDVYALNSKIKTRVSPNRYSVARDDRSDSQSDNGSVYHTPGTGTPNRLSRHTDSTHSNYESPKTMTPQNSQMIPGKTRDESTLDRIKHILPSSSSSVLFDRPKTDSLGRQSTVAQVMPDTSDDHQDIFTGLFEDDASLKLTALDQSLLRHHGPLNMKVILNSKKKAMQSWSQYYIFLYFGLFICFKENPYKAKKPRGIGIIDIAKATIDTAGPIQTKRKFAFILTTDKDQELIFQAADENDMNAWIKHITDDITVRGDQEWETYLPTSWKLKQQLSELPINQDAQASGTKDPLLQSRSSSSSLKESLNLSSSTEFSQKWSRRSTDSKPKLSLLAKGSSKADVEEPKSPSLVFGGYLDAQYMKTNHIPTVLEVCTKLVELKCKDVPELYNLSGNHARIANLKKLINDGDDSKINWNAEISEDIKVITGLIKDYFKDLPTPLIPCELYTPLLRLYKNSDIPPSERQIRLSNIMCHLTVAHRLVLKFILAHLKVVSSWHEKTLQDSHDLAVVFAGLFVRLNMMQDAASAANGDGSVAPEGTEVDSVVIITIVEELIMNYDQILI
ncbi:Rho GTPase activation protein [Paraphysoderma sedebokerense]|nr:Rho GTPase activation protein [Paraphysoderma sedebokerense]